jgi:PKD repeat protein
MPATFPTSHIMNSSFFLTSPPLRRIVLLLSAIATVLFLAVLSAAPSVSHDRSGPGTENLRAMISDVPSERPALNQNVAATFKDSIPIKYVVIASTWTSGAHVMCGLSSVGVFRDVKGDGDGTVRNSLYSVVGTRGRFLPVPESLPNPAIPGESIAFYVGSSTSACNHYLWNPGRIRAHNATYEGWAVYSTTEGPVALFDWKQTRGTEVNFNGSESYLATAKGKIRPMSAYNWDFGDGATGADAVLNHEYAEPGEYVVTLTVSDADGNEDAFSRTIDVKSHLLAYEVDVVQEEVTVGESFTVIGRVRNVGVSPVSDVSITPRFFFNPIFIESPPPPDSRDATHGGPVMSSDAETTATLEPGEHIAVTQIYTISSSASKRVGDVWEAVSVLWKTGTHPPSATDEQGNPVDVYDACEDASCKDEITIVPRPLIVEVKTSTADGETTSVQAGLDRWTSAIYPNGVFYHLVPPFSPNAECNSGCLELEITVTDSDGAPVQGVEVELSRLLLDTDPAGKSVVTPDQGGGIFCFEDKCGSTLKLPLTDATGKRNARFWVPGVVAPVEAYVTAKGSKSGFTPGEEERKLTIEPTKVDLGQLDTATPSWGDMTVLSMAMTTEAVFQLPDLKNWCKSALQWAVDTDAGLLGVKIDGIWRQGMQKSIDWTCGESLGKYIFDHEFATDDVIADHNEKLEILDLFSKAGSTLGLFWFQARFKLPLAGTGETSLTRSPPFISHSSEFADVINQANRAIAWQYVRTGAIPTISFDLHEVSHKKEDTSEQPALHFALTTTPDLAPKVDIGTLITNNYDKRVFLTQERAVSVLAQPVGESETELVMGSPPGKQGSTSDTGFAVGHILVIAPGTQTQESAQIVTIDDGRIGLSVPLRNSHAAGVAIAYLDSTAVAPPRAPINSGGLSGIPGASTAPMLEWMPVAPAMTYAVQVATDSLFQNIIRSFDDLTEASIQIEDLDDRRLYYWRVSATNLLGTGSWSTRYAFQTGRPWGDDLSEARTVTDESGTVRFAWHMATTMEPGEVMPSCGGGQNSLWYRFTPTTSRRVAFQTFDSSFNTVLSVWTGSGHPLSEVACNDDYDNRDHPAIQQSYIEFDAEVGTTYYVRVSGSEDEEGALFLTLRAPTQVSAERDELHRVSDLGVASYPNPAGLNVNVAISNPLRDDARVEVFDLLGRRIAVLHEGPLTEGSHSFPMDVSGLAPGLYIIRAATTTTSVSGRMTIVR